MAPTLPRTSTWYAPGVVAVVVAAVMTARPGSGTGLVSNVNVGCAPSVGPERITAARLTFGPKKELGLAFWTTGFGMGEMASPADWPAVTRWTPGSVVS